LTSSDPKPARFQASRSKARSQGVKLQRRLKCRASRIHVSGRLLTIPDLGQDNLSTCTLHCTFCVYMDVFRRAIYSQLSESTSTPVSTRTFLTSSASPSSALWKDTRQINGIRVPATGQIHFAGSRSGAAKTLNPKP
jgi:hypothetical protein